jgi:hypothetical protein
MNPKVNYPVNLVETPNWKFIYSQGMTRPVHCRLAFATSKIGILRMHVTFLCFATAAVGSWRCLSSSRRRSSCSASSRGPFTAEKAVTPEILRNLEAHYGLDKPLWRQYFDYLGSLAKGDFGPSFKYPNRTVNEILGDKLPVSIELGALSLGRFADRAAAGDPRCGSAQHVGRLLCVDASA